MGRLLKERMRANLLLGALLGLGAIGYGAYAAVKVVGEWRAFRGVESWPAVRALVVQSTLTGRLVSDADIPTQDTKEYQPLFGYEYAVGGRRFRGERSLRSYSSLAEAQDFMARLPKFNDSVTVFYDPVFPARSTMHRTHPFPVVWLALLGFLQVTGMVFAWVSVRAWIRDRTS